MNDPDKPTEARTPSYIAIPADEVTATDAAESIGSIAKQLRSLSWTLHLYTDALKNHGDLGHEADVAMNAVINLEDIADRLAVLPRKVAYALKNPPTRWDELPKIGEERQ